MIFLNKKILIFVFFTLLSLLPVITFADTTSNALGAISPAFMVYDFAINGGKCLLDNPVNCMSEGIMSSVMTMAAGLSQTFLNLSIKTLGIAIEGIPGLGFTPNDNIYVSIGWGIVRNIANAALVIGLVFIAINIILGKEENKAKKTLINFIIIALLINFTPVICGFIIDGCNILTSSFLTGGIDSSYANSITSIFNNIAKDTISPIRERVVITAATFLFSLFAIVIFFLYAILFFARNVILWILVIVSPIAFATKVFPQSKYIKKVFPSVLFWDDWWENFVQWCVIGLPAGMSMYLASKMMIKFGAATVGTGSLETLIGYMVPFIFLIAGFFISISAGGQVGGFVGGLATGLWAGTGARAIGRAREVVGEGATGAAGAALMGKNPLDFNNREAARLKVKETVDNILPPDPSKDKEAATDYLKNHPAAYNLRARSSLQASSINKDFADDIDNAKTKEELEIISRNATNYGSKKTKDAVALKLAGKRDVEGGSEIYNNFVTTNKIEIGGKISGMNDKTAQKELGAKQLANYDVFKNMNPGQIDHIMKQGSASQKKTLLDSFGGGNSDFIAHLNDLEIRKNFADDPKQAESEKEFNKVSANVEAILNNIRRPQNP
jgi:hypothetical protein